MSDDTKVCARCGEEKPLSEFHNRDDSPDGKDKKCNVCKCLPPDNVDIEEFVRKTHELTNEELAKEYGYSIITVSNWKTALRKLNYEPGTINTCRGKTSRKKIVVNEVEPKFPEVEPAGFPESYAEEYIKYEVLPWDRFLVFGDWHVPYHDVRLFDMVYQIAKRYGITKGLLNGDITDNDLFSPFPKTHANHHDYVAEELKPIGRIIRVFMKQFDDLVWLEANHERRLNKAVGGHVTVWNLMEQIVGVSYSQYSYAYLESGGEEILVNHPKNYRKVPGSLPIELCTKYLKNVLCGHVHRLCMLPHQSGKFWAAEGGCCADPKKILYKMKDVDLYGMWNPGFVMIIDGWAHLIEPRTWDVYMTPHADIEKPRREGPTEEELAEIEKHKQAIADFQEKYNADGQSSL